MNERDYALLAAEQGGRCAGCFKPVKVRDIRCYDHEDGWKVDGHEKLQWLYFQCPDPQCHYQTSLAKLGIERPVPTK